MPGVPLSDLADNASLMLVALVFEGVGWFDVGMAVFCGRYDALVEWLLAYDDRMAALSSAQRIALLQSRLTPVSRSSSRL